MKLVLKNLAFLLLVPGTVGVLVPLVLLAPGSFRPDGIRSAGLAPLAAGAWITLWCARDFWRTGRGTPAPIDPPKVLIVHGMYRYIRNPMYLGVLLVVGGEAVLCASTSVAIYCLLLAIAFNLFVHLYEEPVLERMFGDAYARYRKQVPRWIPNLPGRVPSGS